MVAAGALFLFLGANPALAKTIYVDGATCPAPGPGTGVVGDPFCTIQEAVDDAASGDTIDIATGIYTENVTIDENVTLLGAGPGEYGTIVDGDQAGTVFVVVLGVTVTISDMTIRNGHAETGGGILNTGTLTLNNSTVSGNTADDDGGGICNEATLILTNSTVSGNTATFGGGIFNILGMAELINSTVSDNTAAVVGGGILNLANGTLHLSNVTVSNNTASISDIFGPGGGGIATFASPTDFRNTIIANNVDELGGSSACVVMPPLTVGSFGYNLDSDGTCFDQPPELGDLIMMDPLLGPLAENYGSTFTHALLPGSPAIDAGNPDGCTDATGGPLATDQRGKPRPETAGGMCDIGAFEVQPAAAPLDHFLSYQIRPSKHARDHEDHGDDHEGDDDYDDDHHGRGHERRVVSLKDQFGERTLRVVKPVALLNPADKNGEGIYDPDTHLMSYKVEGRRNHRPRVKNIKVTNQFGVLFVDLVKADRLLVPASKSREEEPANPPDLANINVDHFLCYRVKRSRHTDRFQRKQVSVTDQFNNVEPKSFDVKQPTRLCTPVDKNGEGMKNPYAHMMCYSVKRARGEPRHERIKGLWVNDQFGAIQVDTRKEKELCVPSETRLSDVADEAEHAGNHHFDRNHDHDDHDDHDDHGDDDSKGKDKSKGKSKGKDKD